MPKITLAWHNIPDTNPDARLGQPYDEHRSGREVEEKENSVCTRVMRNSIMQTAIDAT